MKRPEPDEVYRLDSNINGNRFKIWKIRQEKFRERIFFWDKDGHIGNMDLEEFRKNFIKVE